MDGSNYLFAIYDEADYEQVDDIFLELYKRGIPVKSAKDNYEGGLESLISECTAVMFVISRASLASGNIGFHIQLAEQQNKHIIPYFLDDPEEVTLPKSLLLKMDGSATIPACDYADNGALVQRVLSELKPYFPEVFDPSRKKKKSPVLPFLTTAVLCVAIVLSYFLWIRPANHEKMLNHVRQSTVFIYASLDEETASSGSGFFVDAYGTVATNFHVIDDAVDLYIKPFGEDFYYTASVISTDETNDLALLQIEDLYQVTNYLSLSGKEMKVGDSIYVSGYPKGIDLIVSNGIVSNNKHYAYNESAEYYMITAAISPGNSGGPVVNDSGKVVGIATAKYEEAENVNLARPVSYLKKLLKP